jgi:hypothetical protein
MVLTTFQNCFKEFHYYCPKTYKYSTAIITFSRFSLKFQKFHVFDNKRIGDVLCVWTGLINKGIKCDNIYGIKKNCVSVVSIVIKNV